MLMYAVYEDFKNRYLYDYDRELYSFTIDENDSLVFDPEDERNGYFEIVEDRPLTKLELLEAITDKEFRDDTLIVFYENDVFYHYDLSDAGRFEDLLDRIRLV